MIRFEITESPLDTFTRLERLADDLRPYFQDVGEYLIDSTRRRFVAGAGPDGEPWAPTKKGGQPLIGESRRLSREFSYRAGPRDIEFGSPMIYSAVMHFGASRGQFGETSRGRPIPFGDIEARPFIGLSDEDRSHVIDIIEEHTERLIE